MAYSEREREFTFAKKLKQTQRKQTSCIRNKIYYNIIMNPKKLQPGLVASYNLRPGDEASLFLKE